MGKEDNERNTRLSRTLFMGGISLHSTFKEIHKYLSRFGQVERLQLPRDPETSILKGYAKAIMSSHTSAEFLASIKNHHIGGLDVGISIWKPQDEYLHAKDKQIRRKIHVKLPDYFRVECLIRHFEKFGKFDKLTFKRDPFTNESRKFCYITYKNVESARIAASQRFHTIDGVELICEMSKPPKATGASLIVGVDHHSTNQYNTNQTRFIKTPSCNFTQTTGKNKFERKFLYIQSSSNSSQQILTKSNICMNNFRKKNDPDVAISHLNAACESSTSSDHSPPAISYLGRESNIICNMPLMRVEQEDKFINIKSDKIINGETTSHTYKPTSLSYEIKSQYNLMMSHSLEWNIVFNIAMPIRQY